MKARGRCLVPTKPRNAHHHMQNRAFSKSQRFCKAISIYSWSSQDVGLEVFDVLTIFFSLLIPNILFCLASTTSLISFPKWVNSYHLFKSCYFLLWNQQLHQQTLWFLRGVLYFLKKDLVGIPNFINISIAIKCMVVLPVGITRKETSYKEITEFAFLRYLEIFESLM